MAREMLSGETCGNPTDPPAEPINNLIECLERPGADLDYLHVTEESIMYASPGTILKQPEDLVSFFAAQHEYRVTMEVVGANPRSEKLILRF